MKTDESRSVMYKAILQPYKMKKIMTCGFFNLKFNKVKPFVLIEFLTDKNQNIYSSYYGKDFGDHLPILEILNWGKNNSTTP